MITYYPPIALDAIRESESMQYLKWRNQSQINRWCRQTGLIDEIQQKNWFARVSADPTIRMYRVVNNKSTIGVCGWTSITYPQGTAELSLYIAPECQKQGYGRLAMHTLITHGFDDLGLRLLWLETFEGNPMIQNFIKSGFVHEGILRDRYYKAGQCICTHIMSMRKNEYIPLPRV